jgi:MFS family permease
LGSVVPMEIRGRYITTRQKVCTAVALAAGLCIAFALDYLPGFMGYTVVFAIGGFAGVADILMYSRHKFTSIPDKPEGFSLYNGIKACFTSPRTRDYLLYWTFWSFAINLSAPFFNKYAIDILSLSYMSIIIFGQIVAQSMAFLVVSRWGVLLDRYGSVPVMLVATVSSTLVSSVWLLAAPGRVWPIFIFNFFGGMVWCAHDACMANMQLSHTPSTGRPAALAVYAVFTSVAAATALILGGAILETLSPIIAGLNLTVMGTPFDHYKVVFIIAILVRFTVIAVFLPRVWNEKDMSLREAYAKVRSDAGSRINYIWSQMRFRK